MKLKQIMFASCIATFSLTLLPACVSTQALTTEQCQSGNWQDIGHTDGVAGRSGAYFGKYVNHCANVSGSTPNRILWEQGRQEGLKEFCTELNAYKLGREGYAWQPVCPMDNIEKLEEAYNQGRYYYLRQRDLEYFSYPYPWYYGRPYSWHNPFWYPGW